MTEQKLIELAREDFFNLDKVDKSLITKKVIDEIRVYNSNYYHTILKGVKPECFSKEKALQLLKFDKEIYGLLPKELQEETEILEATTSNINKLPKSLFDNKIGINYILDKWNKSGESWAYGEFMSTPATLSNPVDKTEIIAIIPSIPIKSIFIKPNININEYVYYMWGTNCTSFLPDIRTQKIKFKSDKEEMLALIKSIPHSCACLPMGNPVKHID